MRIAVIGRTRALLEAARLARRRGHELCAVWTCAAEAHYDADVAGFAALAAESGALFSADRKINSTASITMLQQLDCDVALSVNWPTQVSDKVMAAFRFGILNAHAGDLPRYRGNACPNWAILRGESSIGLCVHQMVESLDAGPVVLRDTHPLGERTYIGDLYLWIDGRIPGMLVDAAEGLVSGKLQPVPQDGSRALRAFPRRPSDGRIDWAQPTEMILRLVRASSRPFPGAFTTLESARQVTIWRASRLVVEGEFAAVPGQVCFHRDGDPVIATGDGLMRLEEIWVEDQATDGGSKQAVLASLRHRLV
jgi:methionyl-tRNA formyltransferase